MVDPKRRPDDAGVELALSAALARAVASSVGLEGVLRAAAELIGLRISAGRITLFVLSTDRASFYVREAVRKTGSEPIVRIMPPLNGAAAEELRQSIAPLGQVPEPKFSGSTLQWPVLASGDAVGMLEVPDVLGPIGEAERRVLSIAADQIAASIRQERLIDALERKQHDLADARKHLARSGWLESLGEVVAGTAHEFNNVISAILGRAQILRRMVTAPEQVRSLEVIEQAASDGSGLVQRIRERMQQETASKGRPVQLNALVRETVERASTRIESRLGGGPIQIEVEPRTTRPVLGDATELRQVLTNLIYNAVDAMPRGGRLVVRTGTDAGKNEVWFEVQDEGTGMDDETRHRIFQPFFTTKGANGTGLGLSVSQEIISRHGGRFEVHSHPGQGTRIRALLPAHFGSELFMTPRHGLEAIRLPGTPSPAAAPPVPAAEGAPAEAASTPARILVIDDDRAVRDVLTEILRTGDHQVVAASSGEEGLALFRESPFDLVFTDLGMPSMNGWEVAAEIKAQSPGTPVGVITGWDTSVDRVRLNQLGVDLIVAKPFRLEQVLAVVASALSAKASGPARAAPERSADG